MAKASQLRDMSTEELKESVDQVNKELYTLVNELKQLRKNEKPHRIPLTKKKKARLLTIIRERELGISQPARGGQ